MIKNKSWLRRHLTDPYVKEAQRLGYASRAAFKLLGIQEKDKVFKSGMTVIDLGSTPGGWSQVARKYVGQSGKVIAIDLLPMDGVPDVIFIQGDFNDEAVLQALFAMLDTQKGDVIISDMAPNLSGQKSIDFPRMIHLLELTLDCATHILKPNGSILCKAFQGPGIESFVQSVKLVFSQVKYRKPDASRAESREVYVLATGYLQRTPH